jgi:hypothetical protein
MAWSTLGGVGYGALHIDGGGFNPSPHGVFILAGTDLAVQGELEGVHLLDLAPTLLQLGELEIPDTMKGRPLGERRFEPPDPPAGPLDEEELIRERLRGLGYIA